MKYYKVVKDNIIIDVLNDVRYIVYQKRNHINLIGQKEDAFGILSSDRSTIWHVEGLKDAPIDDQRQYQTVKLLEITPEEYDSFYKKLFEDVEIPYIEDVEEEEEEEERVLSAAEIRLQLSKLQGEIEILKKEKEGLVNCILEMSQRLYD